MIIPVSVEFEKTWAELCVALWPEQSLDDLIKEGRKSGFRNQFLYLINGEELASDCELHNDVSRKFHNKVGFKEANVVVCFVMDLRMP